MRPKRWKQSGETRVKEMNFQLFSKGSDGWAISYLEGKRVLKSRCVMTEGIRKKMFV